MTDPTSSSHVCSQSCYGHPSQLQPQGKYYVATPLRSCSAPHHSSNTHNHPDSYLRHSATVGHAVQQQAPHNSAPTSPVCLPTGKLFVTFYKARNIRGYEWKNWGMADPYGVIKFGGENVGEEAKTSVRKDAGSHPVWNQVFVFVVKRVDPEYNELSITLYNKNRAWRKDDVLGQLKIINLGQYIREKRNKEIRENWYPVFQLGGEPMGEILLDFDFIHKSPEDLLNSSLIVNNAFPLPHDPNATYKISILADVIKIVLQGASILVPLILI